MFVKLVLTTTPIADCLSGFHHPEGHPDQCVADVVMQTVPVPSLSVYALLVLSLLLAAVGVWVIRRGQQPY